jgi:hypothetical protein
MQNSKIKRKSFVLHPLLEYFMARIFKLGYTKKMVAGILKPEILLERERERLVPEKQ